MENSTLKALQPSEMNPPLNPTLVTDKSGLEQLCSFLERTKVFGYDLETNVVDNFTERRIRTMQFGDRNEQYVVDLLAFCGTQEALIAAQGPQASNDLLKPVVEALKPFLESKDYLKIGQNLQFEYETGRYCLGVRTTGLYDTLIAERNIYAGLVHFMTTGFWALENLVARYTGLEMQDTTTGTSFDLCTPLTETQIIYAALDARLVIPIRLGQLVKIEKDGLKDSVEIDFASIPAFGDMFLHGVQTDDAAWTELIRENLDRKKQVLARLDTFFIPIVGTKYVSQDDKDELNALEVIWRDTPQKTPEDKALRADRRKAYMTFRTDLNERGKVAAKCAGDAALPYGSPQKLLNAFRKLGFSAKKLPNTSDPVLEQLAKFPNLDIEDAFINGVLQNDLPVIDLLRLYRSIDKQLSTYGTDWISDWTQDGHRNPATQRIHSRIDLFGTDTGRTSSSNPNIQNIPKSKKYRHCFTARPGYKIITIDFNGCELRIMAEMSQEPVWLNAFLNGWDVHSVGAEILFGQEWTDGAEEGCRYVSDHDKCKCKVHKKLRGRVKAINFGLAYGMGPGKLARELGITFEEAQALLERYKAAFPTVMAFLERLGSKAKTQLEARTIVGTRRRWKKPSWDTARERAIEDAKEKRKKAAAVKGCKPEDLPLIVTDSNVSWAYTGMFGSIEREGKNSPIQGTNANLSKLAMALAWEHLEIEFGAFFYNMVHDELVIEVPEDKAEACRDFVGGCMTQAGAMWIKSLPMTWEAEIEDTWTKG